MKMLYVEMEVPFWTSFRHPAAVNYHLTFPVPPPTTLYGLLAAALGLPADDYSLTSQIEFTVRILEAGEMINDLVHIIKYDFRIDPHTLVHRQRLIMPVYGVFIKGDEDTLKEIEQALHKPFFPLCLGESDDLVEIKEIRWLQGEEGSSSEIDSIVPLQDTMPVNVCEVIQLPYRFNGKRSGNKVKCQLEYKTYYFASKIIMATPIPAINTEEGWVCF
jgi:CRISPR-associated protein Cas5 subtype I-B